MCTKYETKISRKHTDGPAVQTSFPHPSKLVSDENHVPHTDDSWNPSPGRGTFAGALSRWPGSPWHPRRPARLPVGPVGPDDEAAPPSSDPGSARKWPLAGLTASPAPLESRQEFPAPRREERREGWAPAFAAVVRWTHWRPAGKRESGAVVPGPRCVPVLPDRRSAHSGWSRFGQSLPATEKKKLNFCRNLWQSFERRKRGPDGATSSMVCAGKLFILFILGRPRGCGTEGAFTAALAIFFHAISATDGFRHTRNTSSTPKGCAGRSVPSVEDCPAENHRE